MNKVLFIIIGVIIIAAVLIWFLGSKNKVNSTKELELTYKMSAGIPFKRVYEIEDESIVELVKKYIKKNENVGGKAGAPIYTSYVFKGLKEGITTITFKVISISDENNVMSEDKIMVQVDSDNNIKVVDE